jgi:hypothetical protein
MLDVGDVELNGGRKETLVGSKGIDSDMVPGLESTGRGVGDASVPVMKLRVKKVAVRA